MKRRKKSRNKTRMFNLNAFQELPTNWYEKYDRSKGFRWHKKQIIFFINVYRKRVLNSYSKLWFKGIVPESRMDAYKLMKTTYTQYRKMSIN